MLFISVDHGGLHIKSGIWKSMRKAHFHHPKFLNYTIFYSLNINQWLNNNYLKTWNILNLDSEVMFSIAS